MLTLTRNVGQRIFIGGITVQVVDATRNEVTLRVIGAEESSIQLVDTPAPAHLRTPQRRKVAPRRGQAPPPIIEVRRSRKPSGKT